MKFGQKNALLRHSIKIPSKDLYAEKIYLASPEGTFCQTTRHMWTGHLLQILAKIDLSVNQASTIIDGVSILTSEAY